MLLDTLGGSLLGNILAAKGVKTTSVIEGTKSKSQGRGINRAGVMVVVLLKWIFNAVSSFNHF